MHVHLFTTNKTHESTYKVVYSGDLLRLWGSLLHLSTKLCIRSMPERTYPCNVGT